ncbi:MAG: ABC transporter permease [Planctomycetota bacterium]
MSRPMSLTLPRRIEYARDLLAVLVLKELRVRYKRTVLGYAWSLLQPLAFAVVYYLVFKMFIRIDTGDIDYSLFLICGLFAWQWFSNGVGTSTTALISNAQLITKVRFPRVYAVLSGFMNDLVHFLLSVPVILAAVYLLGDGGRLSWLWWLPILLVIQAVLVLGLALIFSVLTIFLRDLERLVTIGLVMLFHLTPVVYPASIIPEGFRWMIYANPMASLAICWRDAWIKGQVEMTFLAVAAASAAAVFVLGVVLFTRLQSRVAEVV